MHKETATATKIEALLTCTGCIHIIQQWKAATKTTYKCNLSQKTTSPSRTACSLREERG